jgi:hypothetical protein
MKLAAAALALALLSVGATPVTAQDKPVRLSLGYSFAKYLEEDAGSVPLGFYFSVSSARGSFGWELDLAYHRDSEELFDESFVLNTFTATAGPKFMFGTGKTTPFLHVLGGLRYDSIEDESNTSWGGMAGLGVDIPIGSSAFLRLGADFQIFFEDDENLKTLRLNAGFSF